MDEQSKSDIETTEIPNSFMSATDQSIATTTLPAADDFVSWTASEFVAHQKEPKWYLILGFATLVSAIIVWVLTKDKITTATVLVGAAVLAILATKKPRELNYLIDQHGLHIAQKDFPYHMFRSFSVVHQGAFSSLVFMPLKRFALLTTAYYDPADEEKIIGILSLYLPLEEKKRDIIDELLWKIRY